MSAIDELEFDDLFDEPYYPPRSRRELTPGEIKVLRDTPVTGARTDLLCPDCGALMVLRVGKFGRFYGCSTWSKTGCRGSHGADTSTGSPYGIPVDARIRDLRKRVLRAIEEGHTVRSSIPEGRIAEWGEIECIQALRALDAPITRYDLLALDEDFFVTSSK